MTTPEKKSTVASIFDRLRSHKEKQEETARERYVRFLHRMAAEEPLDDVEVLAFGQEARSLNLDEDRIHEDLQFVKRLISSRGTLRDYDAKKHAHEQARRAYEEHYVKAKPVIEKHLQLLEEAGRRKEDADSLSFARRDYENMLRSRPELLVPESHTK